MNNFNDETQTYTVEITEKKINIGTEEVSSYGLVFKMQDGTTEIFDDITLSKEKIELLFDIFLNENIEVTHIEEILCDFVDMLHSVII